MDLAGARQTIFDLLSTDPDGTPDLSLEWVTKVYAGLQRSVDTSKAPLAIVVIANGMDSETISCTVTIQAKPDVDVVSVQLWLDETVEAVERLLDDSADSSLFTRGTWTIDYAQSIDAFVAVCTGLTFAREDY